MCGVCGRNFNIANIFLPATADRPEIVMPPLDPPQSCDRSSNCSANLTIRSDDTEPVIRSRLETHRKESQPIEAFYGSRGLLLNFEITGGIPETMPRLLEALRPHIAAARAQSEGAETSSESSDSERGSQLQGAGDERRRYTA